MLPCGGGRRTSPCGTTRRRTVPTSRASPLVSRPISRATVVDDRARIRPRAIDSDPSRSFASPLPRPRPSRPRRARRVDRRVALPHRTSRALTSSTSPSAARWFHAPSLGAPSRPDAWRLARVRARAGDVFAAPRARDADRGQTGDDGVCARGASMEARDGSMG